jgi:protein phosphatase
MPPVSAKRDKLDLEINLFGRTDVGQIREHNEDNFLIADLTSTVRGVAGGTSQVKLGPGGMLMAVCDGMGGAAAGEVASQLATDVIYDKMLKAAGHFDRDQLALDIVEALEDAGTRILDEANNNRACRGMGTTATVAACVDEYLLLGQVGDSRAYILRGDRLVQVTRDQSLVNQLIEAGQLTEEEAENFEHSNIILQALGTADAVQVDLTFVELRKGDVLMLCSDGLSGMIRDNEIRETMVNVPDPAEACRVLIDDANQAGGHDNITVIVGVFDGDHLEEPSDEDVAALKYAKYALPAWVDDRAGDTQKVGALDGEDTYDDTPLIEITGEFEIDPETSWEDLLDDRPQIPKDPGPNVSNYVIWVAVAVLVFALYYLIAR